MPSKQQRPKPLGQKVGQPETEAGKLRDEYHKTKFYISSTDKHHNNERVRLNNDSNSRTVRVPTFVWALATKWVEDERTPYRSLADLLRDALVHRLHELEQLSDERPVQWEGMRIQVEMGHLISQAESYKETIASVKSAVNDAWINNDIGLFQSILQSAERLATEIPKPYCEVLRSYVQEQQKLRQLPS